MPVATYPLVHIPLLLAHAHEAIPLPPRAPVPVAPPVAPASPLIFLLDPAVRWLALALALLVGGLVVCGAGAVGLLLGAGICGTWVPARRHYRLRYAQQQDAYHEAGTAYAAYLTRQAQYKQDQHAFAMADDLPQFRQERLAGLLAATLRPQPIPVDVPFPPQGRSEAAFLAHLRQHFGADTIFVNCRVPVDDPRLGTRWYYPDFVYCDSSGLCIDIEIDEPYVWATGVPHHCQGQDEDRNAFFLRKQWAVIRFAEEQVVRQPLLCCQVIAAEVFALTRRHYAARFYWERLMPLPQWDHAHARRMAANRTRTAYLPAAPA
jgi:hypothetical protein